MKTQQHPMKGHDIRQARLLAELQAHVPADGQEAAHRERMLALAGTPADVFSRHHFVPGHFTASAFVLAPDEGALLLIFHQRLGRWLQPGGHIDPGDPDVLAAAQREVREETGVLGLDVLAAHGRRHRLLDLDIHPIPAHGAEPRHEHFDVRAFFRARATELRAGLGVGAARWVPLAAVLEDAVDRSVERGVAKLLARREEGGWGS